MYSFISSQETVLMKTYCRKCLVLSSMLKSGRVSFMLSGSRTTQRQWENLIEFSTIFYEIDSNEENNKLG